MNAKVFSQRFNNELSSLGLPEGIHEKTKAVAKMFGITNHLANDMIFGYSMPSIDKLNRIAEILEVCPKWLSGATERKKAYSKAELTESE